MKHDVKIRYSPHECLSPYSEFYKEECHGFKEGCSHYGRQVDDNDNCQCAGYCRDVFEVKQTTKVFYEDCGLDPYTNDHNISLYIGNKDYSSYWIKHLEVDGEVIYHEE